ncbi:hypothetical protein ABZ319_24605 [Nocardia sp. NPDC005978]|uniref:hypothetical protein n=1 Tax=Nocardia sp. NPDC005978 TaxID=3156725 RepID=UPI0033BA5650
MPAFAPITPDALTELVADRVAELPGFAIVAVDGADAADPVSFAHKVAAHLRAHGRPAEVVSLHDYVRPASVRLEYDRDDEFTYRTGWFDYPALTREVIDALHEHGRWLPALWNETTDRSARARIRTAPAGLVVLIAGPMLLGRGLSVDLSVALRMSEAAVRRRTAPENGFTVTAAVEHARSHPQEPDLLVAWDHPDRPAVRLSPADRR